MYFRSLKKSSGDIYINDPVENDKDGNALTLNDIIADDICLIDRIDLKMKAERLGKAIQAHLDSREKEIIIKRYGLDGTRPLTQRETAIELQISRSYVSRIEKKAMEKLRKALASINSN